MLYFLLALVSFGVISFVLEHIGVRKCPLRGKDKKQQLLYHFIDGVSLLFLVVLFLPLAVIGVVLGTTLWFSINKIINKARIKVLP